MWHLPREIDQRSDFDRGNFWSTCLCFDAYDFDASWRIYFSITLISKGIRENMFFAIIAILTFVTSKSKPI